MNEQNQPEKMSAKELRDSLAIIIGEMESLRDEIARQRSEFDQLVNNLLEALEKAKAAQPQAGPAAPAGALEVVQMTSLVLTYDPKGQPMYHAMGGQYTKFGARIWPEFLEPLQIKTDELKPGPNEWKRTVKVIPATSTRAPKVVALA